VHRHIPLAPSLLIALALALAPASFANAPSSGGASAAIEELHEGLLGVMKEADAIGYRGRYDRLYALVLRAFDLPFMAEKTVGRHWSKLSADEQKQWLESFHEMTAATYAGRFEGFSGQSFAVVGEEPAGHGTTLVRAVLHNPSGDDVQLDYRLHESAGTWRVIDVYLNGTVSELALRRSEYSAVLKRDGFAKLIETIEGKTQELAAGPVN